LFWTPANVFSSRWTRWKYHGLALIAVGLIASSRPRRLLHVAAAFTAGVLIFSGCLYAYVLTGAKPWAMIVPVGGMLLLLGWLGGDPVGSGRELVDDSPNRLAYRRWIQSLTEAFQGCDGAGRFLISDFGLIPRRLAISTSC
jgi:hypothetical protein